MAVSSEALEEANASREADRDVKGKAVYVLHAWRDYLWEMGTNAREDVPSVRAWADLEKKEEREREEEHEEDHEEGGRGESEALVEDTEKSLRISSPDTVLTPEGTSHSGFLCLTFANMHSFCEQTCPHVYITRSCKPSRRHSPPSLLQRFRYPHRRSGQAISCLHARFSRWAPVCLSVCVYIYLCLWG